MLMTGALSVVEPGSPIQLVLATLVMLAFTLITLKLAPYRHKSDDWATFLVSLVITGNTQAGFVLLMDKDNSPHNFNPKNIEALLLFIFLPSSSSAHLAIIPHRVRVPSRLAILAILCVYH